MRVVAGDNHSSHCSKSVNGIGYRSRNSLEMGRVWRGFIGSPLRSRPRPYTLNGRSEEKTSASKKVGVSIVLLMRPLRRASIMNNEAAFQRKHGVPNFSESTVYCITHTLEEGYLPAPWLYATSRLLGGCRLGGTDHTVGLFGELRRCRMMHLFALKLKINLGGAL